MKKNMRSLPFVLSILLLIGLSGCGNIVSVPELQNETQTSLADPKSSESNANTNEEQSSIANKALDIIIDEKTVVNVEIEKRYEIDPSTARLVVQTEFKELNDNRDILRRSYYSEGTITGWVEATQFANGKVVGWKTFDKTGACIEEANSEYNGDIRTRYFVKRQNGDQFETFYDDQGRETQTKRTFADGTSDEVTHEYKKVDERTERENVYIDGKLSGYYETKYDANGNTLSHIQYNKNGEVLTENNYNPNESDSISSSLAISYTSLGSSESKFETVYDRNGRVISSNGFAFGYDNEGRHCISVALKNGPIYTTWIEYETTDARYKFEHIDLTKERLLEEPEPVNYDNNNRSLLKKLRITSEQTEFGGEMYDSETRRTIVLDGPNYEETYKYEYSSDGLPKKGLVYNDSGVLVYELTYDDHGNITRQHSLQESDFASEMSVNMSALDYEFENKYDNHGRLVEKKWYIVYPGSDKEWNGTEQYSYDKTGRMILKKMMDTEDGSRTRSWIMYSYSDRYGLMVVIEHGEVSDYTTTTSYYGGTGYTDADGGDTTMTLDRYGNIVSSTSLANWPLQTTMFEYDAYGNCVKKTSGDLTEEFEYYADADKQIDLPEVYFPILDTTTSVEEAKDENIQTDSNGVVTGTIQIVHHEEDPEIGGWDYDTYIFYPTKNLAMDVLDVDGTEYYWAPDISEFAIVDADEDVIKNVGKLIECTVEEPYCNSHGELTAYIRNIKVVE